MDLEADGLVIGTGTAGLAATDDLSNAGIRVTILVRPFSTAPAPSLSSSGRRRGP